MRFGPVRKYVEFSNFIWCVEAYLPGYARDEGDFELLDGSRFVAA